MPSPSKAVLAALNLYLLNNNVKTSMAAFVANVPNANGDITTKATLVLANGGTYNYTGAAGNLITVVYTDKPLVANITLAGGGVISKTITSLFVCDFEVASISFTNNDAADNANLTIISG